MATATACRARVCVLRTSINLEKAVVHEKHEQTRTNTNKHEQTRTNTNKHEQIQMHTVVDAVTLWVLR